ncbi:MAG: type II toxin-antitoxin system Phd/YefM family antitoxin [Clostridiales bacterium]|nr:type II toxin-antitoxin system Phd/YefM family antitoxin [Clostridiales bacterium]
MIAINYSQFRGNMKEHLDQVTDDFETLVVTRKENKNVVVISEESYNNMLENIHVIGNKENFDWLMESKAQLEAGNIVSRDLTDV